MSNSELSLSFTGPVSSQRHAVLEKNSRMCESQLPDYSSCDVLQTKLESENEKNTQDDDELVEHPATRSSSQK